MPYYHLITYGCQMNKNDSERIAGVLGSVGLSETQKPEEADVIVLNTCSVRQTAEDRVYGAVKNFDAMRKKTKSNLIIAVTGCMPGRDRNGAMRAKMPGADLFFPINDMVKLPKWLGELQPELINTGAEFETDYLKIVPVRIASRQAYVTIQTGCNKFCTYCVVPFSRGFERNRTVVDIINEIRVLASHGCAEVTLLGQTVNSYRAPDPQNFSGVNPYKDHFAALLWEVNQIPEIKRLHFTAPHPLHMTDEVIDAMKLPAHLNYLHLPVQSGDNDILRKMNRRYTREQFLELIKNIYTRIPNIALGTDIIVGYCGETEEQFNRTVDLYKECKFDISYHAMYSPRTGTVGHKVWNDDVTREEKKRRWGVLQKCMETIVLEKNQTYMGKTVEVLVDSFEPIENEKGWCCGNSREMKRVKFPGNATKIGEIAQVEISKALEWIMYGKEKTTVDTVVTSNEQT